MARLRLLLCLILFLAPASAGAFTLGVLPIHGTRVLVERYDPLRLYLERSLRQPVRVESAPDFARFQGRTLRGDFDLTITTAHFARIAQKDRGFQPLVQFQPDHDALLVYSADRPLASPRDIRSGQLAVIDRLAITAMACLQYLDDQGLESGRDYQVVEHRTHASVAHALINGLALAAVTTSQGLMQIPDELRSRLVAMKHIADIPAFVFLARPDLPPPQADRLRTLLLEFPRTAEGMDFMTHTGYIAVRPIHETTMKRADIYLKETRKALGARQP